MPETEVKLYNYKTPPSKMIFVHARNTADSAAMTGDYSGTKTQFYYQPGATERAEIARAIMFIEDVGTVDSGKYGNDITLTNGIKVVVRQASAAGATPTTSDDIILDLLDGGAIKTNAHWAALCHDVSRHAWGAGNDSLSVRWTFAKSGEPIYLDGQEGYYLSFELNDDFSGLVNHGIHIQGRILE